MTHRALTPPVGTICRAERRETTPESWTLVDHVIVGPADDAELQRVLAWFQKNDHARALLTDAVVDAVDHVLDGAYTGRMAITDLEPQEKTQIGIKLESRILEALALPKEGPLDTTIEGVAVDIKNSVGTSWMISIEDQCRICLIIGVDQVNDRFSARLMRTHRKFLGKTTAKGNGDKKRGISTKSQADYAIPLFDPEWTPLPRNPLRDLTPEQHKIVFAPGNGLKVRATHMFSFLPGVVIPRRALLTVGTRLLDPMRRIRQAKDALLKEHGLVLLNGQTPDQRGKAKKCGYEIGPGDWIAIPAQLLDKDAPA
ncbi:NaeI family type II restriction endonuclease [Micrococcus sp. HOU01]|uniref:NaeI family type II restriction endonuclease n=1 Tax=Micrococcus sp. HOU01 TaxID=3101753 RepID=UPI002D76AF7C|nr:NaeI family type II restriction endonuclease [Micrococcus sp. HOU1]WRQ42655.1 NaeI family type II restriction endonuclease [Micrococcus sp. HOU1]